MATLGDPLADVASTGSGGTACTPWTARSLRSRPAVAKVAVRRAATSVIDRAIQVHGGAGVTDVMPLAAMYGSHRAIRLFDGPDEVYLRSIAKAELGRAPVLPPGQATGEPNHV